MPAVTNSNSETVRAGSEPLVSVVVCTHNGEATIGDTLRALTSQDFTDSMEIVVIDDGSTDLTSEIVRAFPVRLITLPVNVGLSAARNRGIEATLAPFVAFTDDDCIPPRHWVTELHREWTKMGSETQAIGGTVEPNITNTFNRRFNHYRHTLSPTSLRLGGASFILRLRLYLRGDGIVLPSDQSQYVLLLVGANMSFRRDALVAVGGFDETRRFGGDEAPVCLKIQERWGVHSIWCAPSIVMGHNFDSKLRDTFRRAYAYGIGSGRDYAEAGGIPSLRPIGGLIIAMVAVSTLMQGISREEWWIPLVVAAMAPYLPTARGSRESTNSSVLEKMIFPLVAACEEICAVFGFFIGWLRTRRIG